MCSDQRYTFGGNNVCDSEVTNVQTFVLEYSALCEKYDFSIYRSNSTAPESQDNNILSSPLEYPTLNLARGFSEISMQVKHSQEFRQVMEEVVAYYDASVLSTTVRTNSPVETGEEIKTDDHEGLNYNGNSAHIEVEEEAKSKSTQSKYKNKPKELLQKAVQIYNHIKDLSKDDYNKMMTECDKSDEEWTFEGANLEESLRIFEMMTRNVNKKEAAKIKKTILRELEAKKYCCFAGLCELMPEISSQVGDIIKNFSSKYKDKISQRYFKENADKFESKDLFSWMLLVQIVLVLIPEDPECIELLPLKKSTICLSTWLLESPMKKENKDIYKNSTDRNHLRKVMTEIYNNLMNHASTKMDQDRLNLLQRISSTLGTTFAPMQESPRRVARVVKARASPQNGKIDDDIGGKRSFSKAPTKKVKKKRK